MEDQGPSIDDYLDIARRRKFLFIFTAPVLLFISVVVIATLPPIFESKGTILIQDQEIPEDLVRSTVNSYAEQQIETTRQRILTRARIMEIIEKFNLYADIRQKASVDQLSSAFRSSMGVKMISADVPGQWGRIQKANIAFVVSFMDKSPKLSQTVANELVTLFLEDNVRERTSQADDTAKFLEDEADRMQARVQETENKIAEFKVEYADSLPELLEFNLAAIERLEEQLITTQDDTVRLADQIHSLNLELSNISPYQQFSSDSSSATITPRQRLMELKEQYVGLTIEYSDSHPDIVRLKEEMALAEKAMADAALDIDNEEALNPVYRQLKFQIDSKEKDLTRLKERYAKTEADLAEYKERVKRTHQVKRVYDDLTRDYENSLLKYRELRGSQLEANVAQNLEAENKAGSFKLIEPPTIPGAPVKPERFKLMLMAAVLSFGVGIGLMLAAEFLDQGVRGVSANMRVIGSEPLAIVPHIYNAEDLVKRRKNRFRFLWGIVGCMFVGMVFFHFFVISLDIIWLKVMGKLNLV